MELRPSALSNIAKMICGDQPYHFFPYRSSSYLTRFFEDIDLPYVHDGSTRSWWVRSVLNDLNSKPTDDDRLPSKELIRVIEYVVHHDHFMGNINYSHAQAIEVMNEVLKSYELEMVLDPKTNIVVLHSTSGSFISTAIDRKKIQTTITFSPVVFTIPEDEMQERLVAIMMPLAAEFDGIHEAIKQACTANNVICYRADDIWANSEIMQDIFDLLFCSKIVIADYTGRNPNVMYEIGIAHTLGKSVIPITQSLEDIPFDLKPHRALKYLPNEQGLIELSANLTTRIKTILEGHSWEKPN